MKRKFILFSLLFTLAAFFTNAQVIFDPATVDASKLGAGFDIVDVGGTPYLRVVLNGWGSYTYIPPMEIGADVTSFTVDSKYAEGTSGYTYDQVNTFIKFMTISWGQINAYGDASTTDFSTHTATIETPGTAAILQIAGQETTNWNAVTGDTIYIGVITAVDGTITEADGLINDGTSMENGFAWATANYRGDDAVDSTPKYTFSYTDDAPTAGSGPCLRIEAVNPATSTQSVNSLLYTKVKVTGGTAYKVTGAFKDITPNNVSNFWCEAGLSPILPPFDADDPDSIHYIMGINTWEGCGEGLDGTFPDDYCKYDGSYTIPGEGEMDYYLVLLTGNWSSVPDTFDVLVDELGITVVYPDIITGGNMEDSTAWITWWREDNADTGSFKFNYTDDVPAYGDGGCLKINAFGNSGAFVKQAITITPGHAYHLSGAFKNISTDPITNSWLELICTRVEPEEGMEFNAGDAYVIYERNSWMSAPNNDLDIDTTFETGFNYRSPSFDAPYSKNFVIADTVTQTEWWVLIKAGSSNGDGVTTPDINYLFDEIAMMDLGVDEEAPTDPSNLAADGATITWDASNDNIGVFHYILYDGDTEVASIAAKETDNTYTFTGLAEGTHTLGVVAIDQSGNESGMSTVDSDIVISVKDNQIDFFSIYPNPSTGIVNIVTNTSNVATLEVYNMTGKLIMSEDFTKDYLLEMSDANSGLYFIFLKTEEGVQVEKLILQ